MTQTTLDIAGLETVYDQLATAIDTVGAEKSELLLVKLASEGYDVVMTPGQAYYLDMVQDDAWQEPGASWAGTVPPHHTYTYEAVGDFPKGCLNRFFVFRNRSGAPGLGEIQCRLEAAVVEQRLTQLGGEAPGELAALE